MSVRKEVNALFDDNVAHNSIYMFYESTDDISMLRLSYHYPFLTRLQWTDCDK